MSTNDINETITTVTIVITCFLYILKPFIANITWKAKARRADYYEQIVVYKGIFCQDFTLCTSG